MSAFESHYDVSRQDRTEQRGVSESVFQSERLADGRNFECNLSAASSKLAKDGVLPNVEIEGDRHSDDTGHHSDRNIIFDKLDGDKNGNISGKEWSTKFDNLAGDDQQAGLKDFQGEFGDNRHTTRLFDRADKDHDKIVSAPEFLDLYGRGESDHDQKLGRREFRNMTGRHWNDEGNDTGSNGAGGDGTGGASGGGNDTDANDTFSHLDANKNNQISGKEWIDKFDGVAGDAQQANKKDLTNALGNTEDTSNLLKLADTDGDQKISAMEWMRLFDQLEKGDSNSTLGRNEFPSSDKPGFPPIGEAPPVEAPPQGPGQVPPIELPHPPTDSPYQPRPPVDRPEPPVNRPQPPVERPTPPVERPAPPTDRPSPPIDQPTDRPTTPTDNGEVPRATPAQVEQLFSRIENHGASDRYMQEIKQALGQLPASVVQAAIDGRTRIIANGQGAPGLGGTYNSATNSINVYETSPFETRATLAAEMFHNWDLNPAVGKHISSQPWFQDAFQRARASGINTGDDTFNNQFEFIHNMARYYSGITDGVDARIMNFLGPDYQARTRQALLS